MGLMQRLNESRIVEYVAETNIAKAINMTMGEIKSDWYTLWHGSKRRGDDRLETGIKLALFPGYSLCCLENYLLITDR